jgi:molecular chaperone DnaK
MDKVIGIDLGTTKLRNQTDSLVYSTERTLAEHGSKLSDADRQAVQRALAEAREALESADADRIRRARENLTRAANSLAEAAYRQATGGPGEGTPSAAPGAPKTDDVVDAEFAEVDDRKG